MGPRGRSYHTAVNRRGRGESGLSRSGLLTIADRSGMPRGITHVPENRSPSSDCRIPPLSGPHRFNSVVRLRARSIARPRLVSPSGQPCSVCAGSVPIKEQRRLTWRAAGTGRARRVSTAKATRCSHPPGRTVRAHDYRIAQLVRSEVGAMQKGHGHPTLLILANRHPYT
jgi:hypothetical protein